MNIKLKHSTENPSLRPWAHLSQESDLAFKAFTIYRDLGGNRSLTKTAKELGKKKHYTSQLEKWSKKYEWVRRTLLYDEYLDFQKLELANERLIEIHNFALNKSKQVIEELVEISCGTKWCEPHNLKAIELFLETIGLKRKGYQEDARSQIDLQKRDQDRVILEQLIKSKTNFNT
ncbi:MAG: hypothetical protein RLN81_02170 [Balneolaceae bacterium]